MDKMKLFTQEDFIESVEFDTQAESCADIANEKLLSQISKIEMLTKQRRVFMTKEEFIDRRTKIVSKMLDNPDSYGIYPTGVAFAEFDDLFDEIASYDKGPSWAQIHRDSGPHKPDADNVSMPDKINDTTAFTTITHGIYTVGENRFRAELGKAYNVVNGIPVEAPIQDADKETK